MVQPTPSPSAEPRRSFVDAKLSTGSIEGRFLGKYQIIRLLGKGGMGEVYEALDPLLRRAIAVKILTPEMARQPESLRRFLVEARSAARLSHPNLVSVFEIDQQDGLTYIVMEFVSGGSAQSILQQVGPFHWQEAARIAADVCRGLEAAHRAELVHRDIKPANIMRAGDGTVKLADFGLVKPTGDDNPLTRTGTILGTPDYMSPEQCNSDPVDARSDIYSLGATFYALVTGSPPFANVSRNELQTMYAHVNRPPPDPRSVRPNVPEAVVRVIHRAMAKAPSDRYGSATEMLTELEGLLRRHRNAPPSVEQTWVGLAQELERAGPRLRHESRLPEKPTGSAAGAERLLAEQLPQTPPAGPKFPPPSRRGWRPPIWVLMLAGIAVGFAVVACVTRLLSEPRPEPMLDAPTALTPPTPPPAAEPSPADVAKGEPTTLRPVEQWHIVRGDCVVDQVEFSPDGKRLLVGWRDSNQRAAAVYRLGQDQPREEWMHLGAGRLIWEPTGSRLAMITRDESSESVQLIPLSGSGKNALVGTYLVRPATEAEKATGLESFRGLTFSRNGDRLANGGSDGRLRLWIPTTGQCAAELGPHMLPVTTAEFDTSGELLIYGTGLPENPVSNAEIVLLDLVENRPLAERANLGGMVWTVRFLPDGKRAAYVAGSGSALDRTVVVWQPNGNRELRYTGHAQAVYGIACLPDNRTIASASADGSVQLWNASSGELRLKLTTEVPLRSLAVSRNGRRLAVGGADGLVAVWDISSLAGQK